MEVSLVHPLGTEHMVTAFVKGSASSSDRGLLPCLDPVKSYCYEQGSRLRELGCFSWMKRR